VATVNDVIISAFQMIAVYSPDDIPSARDMSVGLNELNAIIDFFACDIGMLPFRQKFTFDLVSGKDKYSFSKAVPADFEVSQIVSLEECTITFNHLNLPCLVVPYANVVASSRVDNLEAIPSMVYLQRQAEYSEIVFYPLPASLMKMSATIYVKWASTALTLFEEINEFPAYFIRYLKFELARNLALAYPSSTWNERAEMMYQEIAKKIRSSSDVDMTIQGDALLDRSGQSTYQGLLGLLPVKSS
jgi:hypothetical protein